LNSKDKSAGPIKQQYCRVELSWQSASVLSLPLGGATLQAEVSQNQIQFTDSLSLPVLDGELSLNDFQLSLAGEQGTRWQFQGLLSPVFDGSIKPFARLA